MVCPAFGGPDGDRLFSVASLQPVLRIRGRTKPCSTKSPDASSGRFAKRPDSLVFTCGAAQLERHFP